MNFRGSARYIPRYDDHPPPVEDGEDVVGDLDFDIVFAHGHDQQQQQQHRRHRNQPHGLRPAPAADPALRGLDPQEMMQFGIRIPDRHGANANRRNVIDDVEDEEEEQLIFDFDLEDDDKNYHYPYNVNRYHDHDYYHLPGVLPPARGELPAGDNNLGENPARRRREHIRDLAAQVARQQRYVDNFRQQLLFGPHAPAEGGIEGWRRGLGRAEDALRVLRETLRVEQEQVGDEHEQDQNGGAVGDVGGGNNDDGGDEGDQPERHGDRRRRQQRGIDPAHRREMEQDLAELREIELQLRWSGAAPEELRHVAEEMQQLQDTLDGRYETWGRGRSLSPSSSPTGSSASSSSSTTISSQDRRPKRKPIPPPGCYHPHPPLSAEDPRLPPPHVAHTTPTALHDAEGPRYLALVTLDNPHPTARAAERDTLARARQAFARYEAPWCTVVERAMGGGALVPLSSGPKGTVFVVQEGRVDVVGAMLKAREEPSAVRSWRLLGVGVGGAEGWTFCLHKREKRKKGGKEEGGKGGEGTEGKD
ncbi:hypothetical protein SLS55_003735 [Diplodia seriata]|uniref:Uncharacterized protein n=1 Tax=Diplodia seriata TaxID=420778 RepID=A0ABR3CNT5_9PEZI